MTPGNEEQLVDFGPQSRKQFLINIKNLAATWAGAKAAETPLGQLLQRAAPDKSPKIPPETQPGINLNPPEKDSQPDHIQIEPAKDAVLSPYIRTALETAVIRVATAGAALLGQNAATEGPLVEGSQAHLIATQPWKSFREMIGSVFTEETLYRYLPKVVLDALTQGPSLGTLVGSLAGGTYDNPHANVPADIVLGSISSTIDTLQHSDTAIDLRSRSILTSYFSYLWVLNSQRGSLHPLLSHLIYNTTAYPFIAMRLRKTLNTYGSTPAGK